MNESDNLDDLGRYPMTFPVEMDPEAVKAHARLSLDHRAKALELAVTLASSGQVAFGYMSPEGRTLSIAEDFEMYLRGDAE